MPKGPHGEDKRKDVQEVFEDVEPMDEDSGSLLVSRIQEICSGMLLQGLEWKEFPDAGLQKQRGKCHMEFPSVVCGPDCQGQEEAFDRGSTTGNIINGLMSTGSKAGGEV